MLLLVPDPWASNDVHVCFLADETIITWTDPDIGTDVALSFQEGQGCNAIW
jgi:phenolic acid decarboxylase